MEVKNGCIGIARGTWHAWERLFQEINMILRFLKTKPPKNFASKWCFSFSACFLRMQFLKRFPLLVMWFQTERSETSFYCNLMVITLFFLHIFTTICWNWRCRENGEIFPKSCDLCVFCVWYNMHERCCIWGSDGSNQETAKKTVSDSCWAVRYWSLNRLDEFNDKHWNDFHNMFIHQKNFLIWLD